MSAGDVVAYLGLVNPTTVAQNVTVELLPEGAAPVSFVVSLAPKSRKGVELTPQLPPFANFGTLVHFDREGLASLTMRRVKDFFGPSAITIPGQVFCRQEAP